MQGQKASIWPAGVVPQHVAVLLPCLSAARPVARPLQQVSCPAEARQSQAYRAGIHRLNSLSNSHPAVAPVSSEAQQQRTALRMAIPSKGRMAEDTIKLLQECQLSVYKPNPRQYIATIPQLPDLEVWFQRASDVVRKLAYGDVDLGIVGYDMLSELAHNSPDLIVLHDALGFGKCHLGLGVPMGGRFADINTLEDLRSMPEWKETSPLRVVTGYHNVAREFFQQQGFEHVVLLSADGALEAAPLMGTADIIFDLVSTGVTLRENNLKQLKGGKVMDSQGVLVANRRALKEREGILEIAHELIERFEAHLKAQKYYSVVANMRGRTAHDVARPLLDSQELHGLEGPTIAPIYSAEDPAGNPEEHGHYAATICVPKSRLYASVKELRKLGGSGVLVLPMTYIFDEEPERWSKVLESLQS